MSSCELPLVRGQLTNGSLRGNNLGNSGLAILLAGLRANTSLSKLE